MTQYEILKAAQSILSTLENNNIDARDIKYLTLYEDYKRLKEKGHKICYIVYHLSKEHTCGESTIYKVIKRMEKFLV